MVPQREWMLIFKSNYDGAPAHEGYRVTQRASPRVAIIEAAGGTTKEELQRLSGVRAVLQPGEAPSASVRAGLTESERLFVEAYLERFRPKSRIGENRNWDADGFLPPDPPPNRTR